LIGKKDNACGISVVQTDLCGVCKHEAIITKISYLSNILKYVIVTKSKDEVYGLIF